MGVVEMDVRRGWVAGRGAVPAHAMINEVLVAFDPFNKLLKLKNAQEYCKVVGRHMACHFLPTLPFYFLCI